MYLNNFQNTPKAKQASCRLWMYILYGTVWYPFCLVWSSNTCFRSENVSCKRPLLISGKIVPRLFSDYLPQMENKHQTMNVHTIWNCLMPILSIVKLNIAVSGMNNCLPASLATKGGAIKFWGVDAHTTCTCVQSIARRFNFPMSDKASFQVRVTSEDVFLIRFLCEMVAEWGGTWTWWKLEFCLAVLNRSRHRWTSGTLTAVARMLENILIVLKCTTTRTANRAKVPGNLDSSQLNKTQHTVSFAELHVYSSSRTMS